MGSYRLYNVDSPGGYQLTGMTIPGVDILGSKKGYSPEKPWMFEDFDQITFYRVSEEEYERQLALFHSGRYEYEWEEVLFDMAEHNKLLRETRDEVDAIRARQREAQAAMENLEAELLARWEKEKAANSVSVDAVEALLQGKFQNELKSSKAFKLMLSINRLQQTPKSSPSKPLSTLTYGKFKSRKAIRSSATIRWSSSSKP